MPNAEIVADSLRGDNESAVTVEELRELGIFSSEASLQYWLQYYHQYSFLRVDYEGDHIGDTPPDDELHMKMDGLIARIHSIEGKIDEKLDVVVRRQDACNDKFDDVAQRLDAIMSHHLKP